MTHQIIEKHMGGKIIVVNTEYSYLDQEYKGAEFTIKLLPK